MSAQPCPFRRPEPGNTGLALWNLYQGAELLQAMVDDLAEAPAGAPHVYLLRLHRLHLVRGTPRSEHPTRVAGKDVASFLASMSAQLARSRRRIAWREKRGQVARPPHWLLSHLGVDVYRVYRHGNPRDVFQTSWFRTADRPTIECDPTDFDVRTLPEDICRQYGVPTTRSAMATLDAAVPAIREAISRGIVTSAGGPQQMPRDREPLVRVTVEAYNYSYSENEGDDIPF